MQLMQLLLLTSFFMITILVHSWARGGGGTLVFKGGYDARTRKQVKRVVFLTMQPVYARTLKRPRCQKQQNLEKGYVFQPLTF